jgi:hypothetical protein
VWEPDALAWCLVYLMADERGVGQKLSLALRAVRAFLDLQEYTTQTIRFFHN